jgi:hypothetical protein
MISRRVFMLLAVASLAGCASASPGGHTDSRTLMQDEIAKSGVGGSAYDVISRLRPAFLVSRGQTTLGTGGGSTSPYPNVYLDGVAYGDLATLRNIDASVIAEVRLYQAWEAQTKFGMGNNGGVIAVTTRR